MANQVILVPLDRGSVGESAIPLAATLARTLGWELRLLHAISPVTGGAETRASFQAAADRYLSAQRDVVRAGYGVTPLAEARFGRAPTVIADESKRDSVFLIVMGTSQKRGLQLQTLGSVAEEVLDRVAVPVVVVPAPGQRAIGQLERVLLPLDGSPCSAAMVAEVAAFAASLDADVTLVPVRRDAEAVTSVGGRHRPAPALPQIRAVFESRGIKVSVRRGRGSVLDQIHRAAQDSAASLIALPTHGESCPQRSVLCLVAHELVRSTRVPVLAFGCAALNGPAAKSSVEAAQCVPATWPGDLVRG